MKLLIFLSIALLTLIVCVSAKPSDLFANDNDSAPVFSIVKVATGSDPTPLGGTFVRDGIPALGSSSAFNNNGDVAFWAEVSGGTSRHGIFLSSGGQLTKIAALGDRTPIGGTFSFFSYYLSINSQGNIAFRGNIQDGPASAGLFLSSEEGIAKVVAIGDPTPVGGRFALIGHSLLNDNGELAFHTAVTGGSASEGIFLASEGTLQKVVAVGDSTPLGGRFSELFSIGLPSFSFNNAGDVAFVAHVAGGSARSGLFLASGGTVTKIVAQGEATPIGGTFNFISPGRLSNTGDVVFDASIVGGGAQHGVFLFHKGRLTKVVATGDATPIGGTFAEIVDSQYVFNDMGDITFISRVAPSGAYGVFLSSGERIAKVVSIGDRTPTGETFLWFSGNAVNNSKAILIGNSGIGSGDGPPSNQGIFIAKLEQK